MILNKTENSVLWLLIDEVFAKRNIEKEANKHGIDSNRIIYASKVPSKMHLERLKCIDLFLDTFPYNAHTSTTDAIWAECPVLTMSGQTFASRVAGSILSEIDCKELITNNKNEYSKKALELYIDHREYLRVKQKIILGKKNSVIFKPNIFTDNLEKIYSSLFTYVWRN